MKRTLLCCSIRTSKGTSSAFVKPPKVKDEAVELDSCNPFSKVACVYHSSIRHAHYAQGSLTEMQKLHQPDAYQIV